MDSFEEIIKKDADDVIDWACRIEPVNIPKVAGMAIETAVDKRREIILRDHALAILQCFMPEKGGPLWRGPHVDKIVSSLRQIADDPNEHLALRSQAGVLAGYYSTVKGKEA